MKAGLSSDTSRKRRTTSQTDFRVLSASMREPNGSVTVISNPPVIGRPSVRFCVRNSASAWRSHSFVFLCCAQSIFLVLLTLTGGGKFRELYT